MAYPGPSIGPWQVSELDISLINDVLRQIEEQVKLLRGLGPTITTTAGTVTSGTIAIGAHDHQSSLTGGKLSHDDALSNVSGDDHHAKEHTHNGDGSGDLDIIALDGVYDDANPTASKTVDMVIAGPNIVLTESNESEAVIITTTGFTGTVAPVVSITVSSGIVTAVS
jgi:hypothetical protein